MAGRNQQGTVIPNQIKYIIHKPVYDRVMELRKTMTLRELSVLLDIPVSGVGNITNGLHGQVSIERLLKIAAKLDIKYMVSVTAPDYLYEAELK